MSTRRNFFVTHDAFEITAAACAALKWPAQTRYVVWAHDASSGAFRAYIEFHVPVRPQSVKTLLPASALVISRTDLTRDQQREVVTGLNGATVWQHGDWSFKKSGRKTAPPPSVSAGVQEQLDTIPPGVSAGVQEQLDTIPPGVSAGVQEQLDAIPPGVSAGVQEQLDALRKEVEEQRKLLAELQAKPAAQTINVIVLNNFGNEDVSYIPVETLRMRCLLMGVVETVRDLHMNPAYPQNQNVRMVSRRRNTAAIRRNGAWHQEEPASVVVDKLMRNSYNVIIRGFNVDPRELTDEQADELSRSMQLGSDLRSQKPEAIKARQRVRALLMSTPKVELPTSGAGPSQSAQV